MRRWLFSLTAVVALWALLACAAQEEAKPAPAAPAPAPAARPAWQEEWERVLAAAKREGKVVVAAGGSGVERRRALSEPFEKRYGIGVELVGMPFAELSPKIQAERKAGQYLWDVFNGSEVIATTVLKPLGTWDPVEPTLILPEVKDPKNWFGGGHRFADKDRLLLVMSMYTQDTFYINHNLVKEEFKSYKDLLDPKWKGKILLGDPRVSGPGQSKFHFFYAHKELGPDFIRALAKQELAIIRDRRQQAEWLAQGRYPILVGGANTEVERLEEAGAPIRGIAPRQLKEGSAMTIGTGTVALFNRAPHPNAAKVYINWLLTKEGQTEYARASGVPSLRLDAPTDHVHSWKLPVEGYMLLAGEEVVRQREQVISPLMKEVFGE